MALSASAVAMAVRSPKQRRRPRATLYSPPPSHTAKLARGVDAAFAGVKAEHDFAEAEAIPAAICIRKQNGFHGQKIDSMKLYRIAVGDEMGCTADGDGRRIARE